VKISWYEEKPMEWLKIFHSDELGASSLEYCILLACIAVVIVSAVGIFGSATQGLFTDSNAKLPLP
jgi:Flp pilus assembly pilin Flp